MGFTGTTVGQCKYFLEMLAGAVEVKDQTAYDEAVAGLKNLQFLFCQTLARENMWVKLLQEQMSLGDAAFFRFSLPYINEADLEGTKNFEAVFGTDEE